MVKVKPEIFRLGGALATGIFAVALQGVCPPLMAAAVVALAPEIAGHLVTSTDYNSLRNYFRTDHPARLNHDLGQMLLASLERTVGFLEVLFEEQLFSASPLLQSLRLGKAKESFKALKAAIGKGEFKEAQIPGLLDKDEKSWAGKLVEQLFENAKLPEQARRELEEFFQEKFPELFKLAFVEALKDPKNQPGWRAFQILMYDEGVKTNKKLEGKLDSIHLEITALRNGETTGASIMLQQTLVDLSEELKAGFVKIYGKLEGMDSKLEGIDSKLTVLVGKFETVSIPAPLPSRSRLPGRRPCFGRDDLKKQLTGLLLGSAPNHAFVLGGPGIGKSNLALAALHDGQVSNRFGERRCFVRCDSIATKDALVFEIAATLGLPPSPNLEAAVFVELAKAPFALAVDNFETPWLAGTEQAEDLLGRLSDLPALWLIVSIRGENRPPAFGWAALSLRKLELADARSIFLHIAGEERFAADPLLDTLLGEMDGLPLAIELLAWQAQAEPSLAGLHRRWQQKGTEILRRAGGTTRLDSLAVSLALSIENPRMSQAARHLLSLMGLLPDGIAPGDLEALLPGDSDEAAHDLRRFGLAFGEAGRLRLLAPVREHVKKTCPPEAPGLERTVRFYCELAESLGDEVGRAEGAAASARLSQELGNLDALLEKAISGEAMDEGIKAAIALSEFFKFSGLGNTRLLQLALQKAREQNDARQQANCLQSLGDIAFYTSDNSGASARYAEALPLYEQVGDLLGKANCLKRLGDIALRKSDNSGASARYAEALPLYEQVGDLQGKTNCLKRLGDIALEEGRNSDALALWEEALGYYRQIGDRYSAGLAHRRLARLASGEERQRHVEAARQAWESAGYQDLVEDLDKEFGA